ncbi:MAG: hypothetical protein GXY33_00490 [Phycisphaerae bacterium]|nr:hypothetical protein [Phycisphaerae bacterium]
MKDMERKSYTVRAEPKGYLYSGLLDYAVGKCSEALLVVQNSSRATLNDYGRRVLSQLQPFLIREESAAEITGSEGADDATIYRYQYSRDLAVILAEVSRRLYAWLHPRLPENLCLVRHDGDPLLVTVAHEKSSFLLLTDEEKGELLAHMPEIQELLSDEYDPDDEMDETFSAEALAAEAEDIAIDRKAFLLLIEPRGQLYRELLDYALEQCSEMLLVLPQASTPLDEDGNHLLFQLEPFMIARERTNQWPGARMTRGYATVMYYTYQAESAEILKYAVEGLYDWSRPELPEDLCLVRPGGEPFLVSIMPDRESYLLLTEQERQDLLTFLPELQEWMQEERT